MELSIIYLGGTPTRGIRYLQPGAFHRARWMSCVIYAIKMCLFQSQFLMTKEERAGMKRFAAFGVFLYVDCGSRLLMPPLHQQTTLQSSNVLLHIKTKGSRMQQLQHSPDTCGISMKCWCHCRFFTTSQITLKANRGRGFLIVSQ